MGRPRRNWPSRWRKPSHAARCWIGKVSAMTRAMPCPSPPKASTPCWKFLAGLRSLPDPIRRHGPDPGRRKKRLRALADWSFGGGDRYCAACTGRCSDCPARLNRPQTQDGWQVWDLVGRLGGQLRVIPGAVLGWDMGAALALAQALGIDTLIAAELLPEIEAVMVRKLNEQMEGGCDG